MSINSTNQESRLSENIERFLTFHLGSEEYGLDIVKVQEIINLTPVTKIPNVPAYCRGVINLRGKVVPTIDLRLKLGMTYKEDTPRTCIIIVDVRGPAKVNRYGLIVDQVAEVLGISSDCIDPTVDYGSALNTTFISGIGIVNEKVKILLDIDQVLGSETIHNTSGNLSMAS